MAGCRSGGSGDGEPEAGPRDLAVQPASDDRDDALFASAEPAGRSDDESSADGSGGGEGERGDPPGGSSQEPSAPFRRVAEQSDPPGDHGDGPTFADLRVIAIDSNGEDLRATVGVDGRVRERLARGEVVGLGVDLYVGDEKESSYQLFADGRSDGWYAFLYAHDRFVSYKGTFGIDRDRFAFIVPASSVDGSNVTRVSAFFDWSRQTESERNDFSEDHAPDKGRLKLPPIDLL